jgi:hypothetical protein
MTISSDFDLSCLVKHGFEKFDENIHINLKDYSVSYLICIGHSRRGQVYYCLIMENRTIQLLATEPDGDGGPISLSENMINFIAYMAMNNYLI